MEFLNLVYLKKVIYICLQYIYKRLGIFGLGRM